MKRNRCWAAVVLLVVVLVDAPAVRAADLALRGFVRDQASLSPISGATVSASGAQSRSDQTTDDRGFFRLALPAVSPGSLVRLRVQKDGYVVYDRNVSASEEIPLEVTLVPLGPEKQEKGQVPRESGRTRGSVEQRATSEEDLLLAQLKSPDRAARVAAVVAFADRGVTDAATSSALASALTDTDAEVRTKALEAVSRLKVKSPPIEARVIHLLHDPDDKVVHQAAIVLWECGPPSRKAIPDLLAALHGQKVYDRQRPPGTIAEGWAYWQKRDAANETRRALVKTLLRAGEFRDPRLVSAVKDVDVIVVWDHDTPHLDPYFQEVFGVHSELAAAVALGLKADLEAARDRWDLDKSVLAVSSVGPPGRRALIEYAANLRGPRRPEFALLWFNNRGANRTDVLAAFPRDELGAGFGSFLSGCNFTDYLKDEPDGDCQRVALAATSLLILDLEPRDESWKVFEDVLRARYTFGSLQPWTVTIQAIQSFPPESARRALAAVAEVLATCGQPDKGHVAQDDVREHVALKQMPRLVPLCTNLNDFEPGLLASCAAFGDAATAQALAPLVHHPWPAVSKFAQKATTAIRGRAEQAR